MADYIPPDQRRRIGNALMAAQYDRATPEEGNVAQRHGLLPLGTYDNGRTGLAFPGFIAEPVESFNRLLQNGYQGGTGDTRGVEDAFNVAGAAMLGGIAAPKPGNVVGSAGGSLKGGAALGAIPERQGIRAYHGSPHDFDKFDMSKIGTGEGAQAYGHGLYFAENEGVAKSYRDALGGQRFADGAKFDDANAAHQASAYVAGTKSKDEAIAAINQDIAMSRRQMDEKHAQILLRARGLLESDGQIPKLDPGKMYEVNIKANPDDFLDWDKRLGEQSDNVRDKVKNLMLASREIPDDPAGAYKQAIEKYNAGPKTTALTDDPGVIQAYDAMRLARQGDKAFDRQKIGALLQESGRWSPEDARRTFLDVGIPGVKYLDRGSRTAGDGTSNYVVFDDKLIEILRKYGLLGMAGGAAAAEYGFGAPQPSPASPKYRPGDA